MAEKKPIIVIKKITIEAAGHHGGSWKVAFADFMTAMMAFFLVMWLVNQSEEVKKSVAEYFSTPSVIEYNFSNYGVELTLEKLFLDLVNEPLRAFEQFIKPVDKTPNVMDLGHKKIQFQFLKNKLGDFGVNVDVLTDEITFEVPASYLFVGGSARPGDQFVSVMERVREIVQGLKDVDVFINAEQPYRKGKSGVNQRNLADARLDFISQKMEASIEGDNVDVYGKTTVEEASQFERRKDFGGLIKFKLKQKFNEEPQSRKVREVQNSDSAKMVEPEANDAFSNVVKEVSGGTSPEVQ